MIGCRACIQHVGRYMCWSSRWKDIDSTIRAFDDKLSIYRIWWHSTEMVGAILNFLLVYVMFLSSWKSSWSLFSLLHFNISMSHQMVCSIDYANIFALRKLNMLLQWNKNLSGAWFIKSRLVSWGSINWDSYFLLKRSSSFLDIIDK